MSRVAESGLEDRPPQKLEPIAELATDSNDLASVWAAMRDAAGGGSMPALLEALEPVELSDDVLRVRGRAFDLTLMEQRRAELQSLALRVRKRATTLEGIPLDEAPVAGPTGEPVRTQSNAEAAMEIPLVRQTAELFEGTVVRVLRRTDRN